jgi:hypothetical protein
MYRLTPNAPFSVSPAVTLCPSPSASSPGVAASAHAVRAVRAGRKSPTPSCYACGAGSGLADCKILAGHYVCWSPRGCSLETLQLHRGHGRTLKELMYGSGHVFAHTLIRGQATGDITRLVLPDAETGIYAGLARNSGFGNLIVMGVENPVIANVYRHLLDSSRNLADHVVSILEEIRDICLKRDLPLDDEFCWSDGDRDKAPAARVAIRELLRHTDFTVAGQDRSDAVAWLTLEHRATTSNEPRADIRLGIRHSSILMNLNPKRCVRASLLKRKTSMKEVRRRIKDLASLFGNERQDSLLPLWDSLSRPEGLQALSAFLSPPQEGSLALLAAVCSEARKSAHRKTLVVQTDPLQMLALAQAGDFVVLGGDFCGRARAHGGAFDPAFYTSLCSAWANGARVMIATRQDGPASLETFQRWGLQATAQSSPADAIGGGAVCRLDYVVATNFHTGERPPALLPMPESAASGMCH